MFKDKSELNGESKTDSRTNQNINKYFFYKIHSISEYLKSLQLLQYLDCIKNMMLQEIAVILNQLAHLNLTALKYKN